MDWQTWEEDAEDAVRIQQQDEISSSQEERSIVDVLKDDGSNGRKRGIYQNNSRTTKWRRNCEAKKVDPNQKLTSYGIKVGQKMTDEKEEKPTSNHLELAKINNCIKDILPFTTPIMNMKADGSTVNSYHYARYLSVLEYFKKRLEGSNKGSASLYAAEHYWPKNSPSFRARTIIEWAKEFYENRCISKHSQGAHVKRESFLSDNDVQTKVLDMIKKMKPAERNLKDIKKQIEEVIVPSVLGTSGTVSATTLGHYLYEWGYQYRKNKRAIFFDGHEREDAVAYRNEWSKRMVEYMKRSDFYEGDERQDVYEPILENDQSKIVFVTHDESTFYANDGKNDLWLQKGENYIRQKSAGQSIMVSEFQCPCHGTMKVEGWTSRQFFKAGGGREGWWTYEHMVEQLEQVIPLFETLHEGCTAVFIFDNSSNHGAYGDDALVASRMPLKEQEWPQSKKYQFRDTIAQHADGTTFHQTFYYNKQFSTRTKKGAPKITYTRHFKGI